MTALLACVFAFGPSAAAEFAAPFVTDPTAAILGPPRPPTAPVTLQRHPPPPRLADGGEALALMMAAPMAPEPRPRLLRDQPDVLLANTINLLATGLFLTRVHAPGAARGFGIATVATAVPAAGLIAYNIHRGRPAVESIGPAMWIAFAGMDLVLDYALKEDFRKPPRWGILAPFLVLFYGSTVTMWGTTFRHGTVPYAITTATYLLMASSSIYARIQE